MIAHDDALLLAAGAALDDLEPDEEAAYEAHRAGCPACAVAEDELAIVLSDLALVVPERLPPPDLLAGIRLAIDAELRRDGVASTGSFPERPPVRIARVAERRRRPRLAIAAVGLAAAFGVVAIGLGARTSGLQADLDRSEATVQQLRDELAGRGAILAAALDAGHVTRALHPEALAPTADAAVVYVPGTTEAWVVARGLPATSPGMGYQLWYADDGGVHGLQTVPYDGRDSFVAPLGVDLSSAAAVMLTLEPTGGATGEPGPQVVFGEL